MPATPMFSCVRSLRAAIWAALSRNTARLVDVMDAGGKDVVLVETVGVGQSEIEIAGLADIRVVVWAPGAGDEVQAAKAGILEIADLLVVNKTDLPQAVQTEAALKGASSYLPEERRPVVLKTIAIRGDGVAGLVDAVIDIGARQSASGVDGARRRMGQLLVAAVADLARDRAMAWTRTCRRAVRSRAFWRSRFRRSGRRAAEPLGGCEGRAIVTDVCDG